MKAKNFKKVLSLLLAIVFIVSVVPTAQIGASAAEETEWLTFSELVEEKGFVNGIQEPWFFASSTGNDWGYSFMDGYASTYWDEAVFNQLIYNVKAMGYDSIKFWCQYNFQGMVFDSYQGYDAEFNVVGIDSTYLENLEKMLKMCQDVGLYVCLTTMTHNESSGNSAFEYNKRAAYIWNEEKRQALFDNYITPIIELTKKYPNVNLIDLYCEPEAEGGLWNLPRGTNWEIMADFIDEQAKLVKSINPRLETYCSSNSPTGKLYERYSDIDVNYYGFDHYAKTGGAHDPSEIYLDKPFIYGELGVDSSLATTIDEEDKEAYLLNWWRATLNACAENDVKAAFGWTLGLFKADSFLSMLNTDGLPRAASAAVYYWNLDRKYVEQGIEPEMDAPGIMWCTDSQIRFYAARGAEKYRVEKSGDKKTWTEVITFDPNEDTTQEYASQCFDVADPDPSETGTVVFRVVAIGPNGEEKISEISNESSADILIRNPVLTAVTSEGVNWDAFESACKGGKNEHPDPTVAYSTDEQKAFWDNFPVQNFALDGVSLSDDPNDTSGSVKRPSAIRCPLPEWKPAKYYVLKFDAQVNGTISNSPDNGILYDGTTGKAGSTNGLASLYYPSDDRGKTVTFTFLVMSGKGAPTPGFFTWSNDTTYFDNFGLYEISRADYSAYVKAGAIAPTA